MLKLGRVTKVKVFFIVLVYVFNIDLFEFSAAILFSCNHDRDTIFVVRNRHAPWVSG